MIQFTPFGDYLLATVSIDPQQQLWSVEDEARVIVQPPETAPSDVIRPWMPSLMRLIERAEEDVRALVRNGGQILASSQKSLDYFGPDDGVVHAPPVAVDHLHDFGVSEGTKNHLERFGEPKMFLASGPMLPSADLQTVLAANNIMVTLRDPSVQCVVTGAAPIARYLEALEYYTREMNTDQTWLTTTPAVDEYVAFLRAATALINLDTSLRFPVEAVEAMSFGVPVIGREDTVLHEIAPDAGLFLAPNDGPLAVAEAMTALLEDRELRARLSAQARRVAGVLASPYAPRASATALMEKLR